MSSKTHTVYTCDVCGKECMPIKEKTFYLEKLNVQIVVNATQKVRNSDNMLKTGHICYDCFREETGCR